jgi:hypothetical protein
MKSSPFGLSISLLQIENEDLKNQLKSEVVMFQTTLADKSLEGFYPGEHHGTVLFEYF